MHMLQNFISKVASSKTGRDTLKPVYNSLSVLIGSMLYKDNDFANVHSN